VNHHTRRRYLSAPAVKRADIDAVVQSMESGWIAPVGPDLNAFEAQMAEYLKVKNVVGLSSGTAAIHLGLKYIGVKPGDLVLVPTLTFAATVFAIKYLGAEPVFVDVDESWNMDPNLTLEAIKTLTRDGKSVSAAVPVDLYGSPANYEELINIFSEFAVPMFEDAAEGLGGKFDSRKLGSFGAGAALSFNGNKILTTSGGGMLTTNDENFATKVRFWATQSRENFPWYEHNEIGYNYRLSNVLAALGRSQLVRIEQLVARRREIRENYRKLLSELDGVEIQSDPVWGASNAWLSVAIFNNTDFPDAPQRIRIALERNNIESRLIWKPMHQQPVFRKSITFLSGKSDQIFSTGLCLPSGPDILNGDLEEISSIIIRTLKGK
jgi:dTDP-4-amino-4,6-dideoxygalactose transaminase